MVEPYLSENLTMLQKLLIERHGTPSEFATACYRAVPAFVSMDEAKAAINEYLREFSDAGKTAEQWKPVLEQALAKKNTKVMTYQAVKSRVDATPEVLQVAGADAAAAELEYAAILIRAGKGLTAAKVNIDSAISCLTQV